jgi:hypothetical protein
MAEDQNKQNNKVLTIKVTKNKVALETMKSEQTKATGC